VLKASKDLADYNAPDAYLENWGCPPECWNACHFIIAHEAHGASITGPGTIDGNGDAFFDDEPKAYYEWMKPGATCWWNGIRWAKDKQNLRPGQLIAFVKCRDVAVRGVTIRNSPCWSLWFWGCERVRVSDYVVRNGENDGNTDGVDFDCSRDVVLERADIDTGDDAIAIRASARESAPTAQGRLGLPSVTDGVIVRDCRLRSTSSVFRIGVGEGVIRNVDIENVTCDRGGTAVNISTLYGNAGTGGVDIEDVVLRNCRFTGCRVGAVVRSNGGDKLMFGIRRIRFENCSFGSLPPVLESAPGVRFPLDSKEVAFAGSASAFRQVEKTP
jgi:polygalacturonase